MVKLPNILSVLLLGMVLHGVSEAQEMGGALLMKEGHRVLRGTISEIGANYQVQLESGTISVPKHRVAFVGKDTTAIYEYRVASIKGRWKSGDHMNFARWCILNEMSTQAILHYQQVAKQHPDHPYVHKLAIELRQHLLGQPDFREYLGLPPEEKNSAADRLANKKPATSAVHLASGLSKSLTQHPEIATSFVQRVQPILLNRCSQTGCHGALGKNALRIIPPYRDAHQRITNENLQSMLRQIERDDGEALLHYATNAHGNQRQPSIAVTEKHLVRELSAWMEFVKNPVTTAVAALPVNPRAGATPQVVTADTSVRIPAGADVALVPVKPGASGLRPVPKPEDATDFPDGDRPSLSELEALDAELRKILGEAEGTSSQDPFDPASFNKRG